MREEYEMLRKTILLIGSLFSIAWLFGVWIYWVRSASDIWVFSISVFLASPLWLVIARAQHEDRPTVREKVAKYILGGLVIVNLLYYFALPELDRHFIDLITLSAYYGGWFLIGVKVFKYFS
jgi:hypothetical protein